MSRNIFKIHTDFPTSYKLPQKSLRTEFSPEKEILDILTHYHKRPSSGKRNWIKFKNVYHSLRLMMTPKIDQIQNENDLMCNLTCGKVVQNTEGDERRLPRSKHLMKVQQDARMLADRDIELAFQDIKQRQVFIKLVENGKDQDLQKIEKLVQDDPKKFLFAKTSPNLLINTLNEKGETALYVASRNGHLKVVELLVQLGANPNILINRNGFLDSVLSVAIRWQHMEIVQFLLREVRFKKEIYQMVLKAASDEPILKSQIKTLVKKL